MNFLICIRYIDCNGVADGTSMMDDCGVCQSAYLYNYVTHAVSMISDTAGVVAGPTEMIVMPNSPSNPYWNSSCAGCTDANADNYDSTATVDDGSCTYCSTLSGVIDYAIDASGAGACDGMGSVSATGGTSPYNISWPSDPNTLCAGTYTVTITDAAGCVTTVDVTIGESVVVISGCTDPAATNYDATATQDDGTCLTEDDDEEIKKKKISRSRR